MSEFSKTSEPGQVLPDELDAKIQAVNEHLVAAKQSTEKLIEEKKVLTDSVAILKGTIVTLEASKIEFVDDISSLGNEKVSLTDEVKVLKSIKEALDQEIVVARNVLVGEQEKVKGLHQQLEIKEQEVKNKEVALNVFAAGLDERKKKLDSYEDKLKRIADQFKTV